MKKIFLLFTLIFICQSFRIYSQSITAIVEDKTKKIEVTGSAEMQVVPDEIFVGITLQEYVNKQKVKINIDDIQRDFLERCTKAGITKDRIEIQNMSGFDQNRWYWKKRRREQPDLLASTTYIIMFSSPSDIDKLVNSLDDQATQNMYISRTDHSKKEEFRKIIKIQALQAAKAKAQYLCESIGEKVGSALYIEEIEGSSMYYPREMKISQVSNFAASSSNEGIDFQKMTIRYEMKAQFAIQ